MLSAGALSLTPTDWRVAFDSPACRERLAEEQSFMRATGHPAGFYCKSRPVLYSASQRLAYVKTPKGASLAIQDLFQKQFPDYRWTEAHEHLPNDTLVFTFVREPLKRALSAYAEIDIAYALRATPEVRNSMRTTFQHVRRQSESKEVPRLLSFIDDLVDHRFGGDDREHWMPTHAYSQLNFMCQHKLDFIGRLENQAADWDHIQGLANIAKAKRTAFPHAHDSTVLKTNMTNTSAAPVCNRACQLKAADQKTPLTPPVLQRLCDVFASDFSCLGYSMPRDCASTAATTTQSDTSPPSINGTSALGIGSSSKSNAAPVYLMRQLDAEAAYHLVRTRQYANSLFLVPSSLENRSTLFRLKRAENQSFAAHFDEPSVSTSGGRLLREYDRFGWYWRGVTEERNGGTDAASAYLPRAPLALGIPTRAASLHAAPTLTAEVRLGIERSLAEAQQLLLLHRYDRVIVVGQGLLVGAPHEAISKYAEEQISRHLVDPKTSVVSHRPSSGLWTTRAANSSTPHKHFLPGR